jgi:hypothetical protein
MKMPSSLRLIFIMPFIFLIAVSCSGNTQKASVPSSENGLQEATISPFAEIILPTETATPSPEPTLTTEEIAATEEALNHEENLRIFDQFIADLKNGEPETIVGIWIENVLALQVVYQPSSNPGYVSTIDETVTYFLYPWRHAGNHGMLAHNYLAGRYFFNISEGDIITLVFGDGNYEDFEVTHINEYQALQPNSPRSNFINLDSGEHLTANSLFIEVYMGDFHTTLQTCIANGAETEWGRRFTLAPPL